MEYDCLGVMIAGVGIYLVYALINQKNCKELVKITRRRRHVTDYFDTCDFCDTGHSDGKIYVPYRNKTKRLLRISF